MDMRISGRNLLSVRTKTPCAQSVSVDLNPGDRKDRSPFEDQVRRNTQDSCRSTYPVIRLQIVDLLPPHHRPNVFTQKLDHVKLHVVDVPRTGAVHARGVEPRLVAGEALGEAFADAIPEPFEAHVDAVCEDWRAGEAVGREEGGGEGGRKL